MSAADHPVVFIHGLWIHSTAWRSWQEFFEAAEYTTHAPGWPGDQDTVELARANPASVANRGIDDVVASYTAFIDALPAKPIVIGHSFGGMIAQKLLAQGKAAAAVAIDAAQIKGVYRLPLSALRATWPVFKNPFNRRRSVMLTAKQFRYSFGNTVSDEESNSLWERWVVPSPVRPLFEAAAANMSRHSPAKVDTDNADRGPLLLIAGGDDHTVPEVITKSTRKLYRNSPAITDYLRFSNRGHSLTVDTGWKEVAEESRRWLEGQGL